MNLINWGIFRKIFQEDPMEDLVCVGSNKSFVEIDGFKRVIVSSELNIKKVKDCLIISNK